MALIHQIAKSGQVKSARQMAEELSKSRVEPPKEAPARASTRKKKGAGSTAAVARAATVTPGPKKAISIRLDQDVIDHFKNAGDGWQSRINAALRKAAGM